MNSKDSAKSKGVVLFAFNTDVDYVTIADRCGQLISHTLKLPVTLVTELPVTSEHFDNVIYVSNELKNFKPGHGFSWRNGDRFLAS